MADHPAGPILHMAALITRNWETILLSAEFARQCDELRPRILGEGIWNA